MIKICVTDKDIASGERQNSSCCPVALAVRRVTGDICSVLYRSVFCYGRGCAELPPEAQEFIVNFDRYKPVKPFEFEVDL